MGRLGTGCEGHWCEARSVRGTGNVGNLVRRKRSGGWNLIEILHGLQGRGCVVTALPGSRTLMRAWVRFLADWSKWNDPVWKQKLILGCRR